MLGPRHPKTSYLLDTVLLIVTVGVIGYVNSYNLQRDLDTHRAAYFEQYAKDQADLRSRDAEMAELLKEVRGQNSKIDQHSDQMHEILRSVESWGSIDHDRTMKLNAKFDAFRLQYDMDKHVSRRPESEPSTQP